jgi:tetratricopeptide (TPR) repeat protein
MKGKPVLILRIKQAETALADGRLDEAFEIVRSEHVRNHYRGQKLISRLSAALVKRGRDNFDAERIQDALADCSKAEKLAGNTDEVANLRSDICSRMEQKRLREQHCSLNLAQAKRNIQAGWISAGEKILEQTDEDSSRAGIVIQQANLARIQIDEVIAKSQQALQKGDLENAVEIIRQAGIADNKNEKVIEMIFKIKTAAIEKIRNDFDNGRVDLARSMWEKMLPIANGTSDMSELGMVFNYCRKASECLACHKPRESVSLLKKIKVICPNAGWLNSAIEQSLKAADILDELAASPLGLEMDSDSKENDGLYGKPVKRTVSHDEPTSPGIPNKVSGNPHKEFSLSSKFVMHVDGIGGFLVLRENKVTIGPVSSSVQPMVGLMADPNLPVAAIERIDDDYFIRSSSPIHVNNVAVTDKLLADGDHIALSARCSMKFHIPNPASATAVLQLSGSRLGRADIRQVILMDRDILIGQNRGNHIQAESLEETITLFAQNERLLCKAREKVFVKDAPINPSEGIPVDKQVRIGQISFVITKI